VRAGALIVFADVALAGCAGRRVSRWRAGAPPEPMAGHWMLAAVGSAQCNMNFGGTPDATDGTIAPEGGCPGNFFTSRKWTFEGGSLVIRDHNGAPLTQLAHGAPGRFDGKMANGQPMTLSR
jgi:hypothetical protein